MSQVNGRPRPVTVCAVYALDDAPTQVLPFLTLPCPAGFPSPALASFVARAGEKLRRRGRSAGVLTVLLATSPFQEPQYSNAATVALPEPTDATPELLRAALRALERIYRPGYAYKRTGVLFEGLVGREHVQASLWGWDRAREARLMETLDGLNRRWPGAVRWGVQLAGQEAWAMRQARRSPRYTTRWEELAVVRA